MMDKQKEAEKFEAGRMSVIALKNTFADIGSIEFERSAYNIMTGFYGMFIKMTHIDGDFVRFSFMFSTNHQNEILSWGVEDRDKVQKEGKTKDKVKVIYTNGSEEEI